VPPDSPNDHTKATVEESSAHRKSEGRTWLGELRRWDAFALVLPMLALAPLLVVEAKMLWNKQHMQFFPLAIAAVGWFVANEGRAMRPASWRGTLAKMGAWGNLLTVAVASLIHSSWLAHFCAVCAFFLWMLGRFGNLSMTRIFGFAGLALITVPFPFNGDQELVRVLQRASSFACSCMMDAVHILHIRMGNVLELAEKQLLVEEACSGVDSQYALMAVAGVLLLVGRASLWVSVVTILTVPIWAILGNILRIFSIVLGVHCFGIDLSVGWQHMLLGLIAFAMAAWAHWSSVQFLNWLEWTVVPRHPQTSDEAGHTHPEFLNSSCDSTPVVSRFGMSIACAMLVFVPTGWLFMTSGMFQSSVPYISEKWIAKLPGEDSAIPNAFESKNVTFETVHRFQGDDEGQCSRAWRAINGDSLQSLSLDLPFRGGHPLWACYSGSGWTLTSERSIDLVSSKLARNWPVREILMRGPEGQWATLHFIHCDLSGNPFDNSTTRFAEAVAAPESRSRWGREFLRIVRDKLVLFPAKQEIPPITIQFQLLTQGPEVPTADSLMDTRKQFQACREQFLREMEPVFEEMRREFGR
jgi:exosortase